MALPIEELTPEHFKIPHAVASLYPGTGEDREDLAAEGVLGVLRAAARFDPARGTAFSTLCFWAVRTAVGGAARKRHALCRRGPVRAFGEGAAGGREEDEVADARAADPAAAAALAELREAVRSRVALLPEGQRLAVEMRFGLGGAGPATLAAIGEALGGKSKERARQVLAAGLAALRADPALAAHT